MYMTLTDSKLILLIGIVVAFALTIILMRAFADKLPHDQGRAFAVEGALSKGKVRGVGIVFILVFAAVDLIFGCFDVEKTIYIAVVVLCMFSGYFDDASEKPWNEYLKGALDLLLAIVIAVTYLYFNGSTYYLFGPGSISITIPYVVSAILIIALVWTAINVTNCTDGVDGLSASLTIATLAGFCLIGFRDELEVGGFTYSIMVFITVLVAYLWYNATPSTMLMGDAGSRAMGIMIAIAALMCKSPLLYIPFSIVMILDGGLGLIKVSVIRFFKAKNFMKNIRCPLHDQARKVNGWSNTQVVFRFVIIQVVVSVIFAWLYMIV